MKIEIESKFDVGDEVYCNNGFGWGKLRIVQVYLCNLPIGVEVNYIMEGEKPYRGYREEELFTYEEAKRHIEERAVKLLNEELASLERAKNGENDN